MLQINDATCDPSHPRASKRLRRCYAIFRWTPLFFILALFAFAYVTLVGSLAISHNLLHRRAYFKATVELLFSHALITGATWSFLVAVFREAGSPRRSAEDDLESVMLDDTDTSRRRPRKHRPAGESSAGYEEDSDDDNEYDESGDSAGVSRDESQSAPLLGAGSGASALLPGQPRLPARSATSQLDDVRAAVETARTGASAEAQAEPRTLIHGAGLMVKSTGERRWCNKCGCAKPDRAHHCSTCGVCVLRMDHHCPWLASRCVGLRNHKAFFLFVTYTALLCAYSAQECARALVGFVEDEEQGFESSPISWAILLFMGFIFGVALIPFAVYHAWLICRNRTTIESMEGAGRVRTSAARDPERTPVEDRLSAVAGDASLRSEDDATQALATEGPSDTDRRRKAPHSWKQDELLTKEERRALKRAGELNIYDVGVRDNWCQIMGRTWWMWFIPTGQTESDGFSFPVNAETLAELERVTSEIRLSSRERGTDAGRARQRRRDDALLASQLSVHFQESEDASPSAPTTDSSNNRQQRHRCPALDAGASLATAVDLGARPEPAERQEGRRWESAHGEVEWGAPPKKDGFGVLFGVDDESDDGIGNAWSPASRAR